MNDSEHADDYDDELDFERQRLPTGIGLVLVINLLGAAGCFMLAIGNFLPEEARPVYWGGFGLLLAVVLAIFRHRPWGWTFCCGTYVAMIALDVCFIGYHCYLIGTGQARDGLEEKTVKIVIRTAIAALFLAAFLREPGKRYFGVAHRPWGELWKPVAATASILVAAIVGAVVYLAAA